MKKVLIAIAAVVLVAAAGVGAWAVIGATGSGERSVTGACGSNVGFEMSVEDEDGAVEVDFELQSTSPGETWTVQVEQAGTPILTGERQTDEDAELDLDVDAPRGGGDQFTVVATPADEGEPCLATLTR